MLTTPNGHHLEGEACTLPPPPSTDGRTRDALCGHGRLWIANPTEWLTMRPEHFDAAAPPQPLALIPEPDPTGTPDLFDTTERIQP